MRIILIATAFFLLAALMACEQYTGGPPLEKSDQITVEYPNLFLQGGDGKVVCALEEIAGRVRPVIINDGNTTLRIDRPNVNIRPEQPELYNTYVEIQLQTDSLVKTNKPALRHPYTGQREEWVWGLRPAEGLEEGAEVSFRLVVNVTREPKTPGAPVEEIRDVWHGPPFTAKVGPPESRVNAALYGSPLCALGGVFTIGVSLRRRKGSQGDETEDDEIAEGEAAATLEGEAVEEEDEVSSTLYAPTQAAPGDGFLVQVFVHLPEQAEALEGLAKEADETARRRVASKLKKRIRRGTELAFNLQMPGLEVDDPVQTCVWEGEPGCVQFGVNVPADCKPRNIFGTVTVCESSVPIGHLKFTFKITGADAAPTPAPEPVRAADMTRYRQAFISYASKDRQEVLKRVQMLNLARINFFQDLLTLEPGDEWGKLLYEYIDKSDVFFLFWSKAASESEWVRKEIEYARQAGLDATPGPEIVPVIIEGPPHVPPPSELSFLHFNDKFLYFINTRDGA